MGHVARLARLLVPAIVLAALLAPASATAASGMEVALQDDPIFVSQEYYKRATAIKQAQKLNVSALRVNVVWWTAVKSPKSRRKPRKIRYDFTNFDGIVSAARAKGIAVQMVLTGPAPAWAAGNKKVGPYKPNASLYAHFVKAVATQYRGLVTRYSIYNEPNHIGWLRPLKSQASQYRALYSAGYKAIKSVDKNAGVLFGETAPYASRKSTATPPLKFVRDVFKRGALKADGFAHHPYDFDHPPDYQYPGGDNVTIGTLPRLTALLDKLWASGKLRTPAGGGLDVYLTEYGYFASGRRKVSDSRRGTYLQRAFEIAQANPRVRQMLHYLLVKPNKKYLFFDTSIVSRKGKESAAFTALAKWTSAAAADGRIKKPGGSSKPPDPPPPPGYRDPVR
jgi:hypothetical protein